MDSKDPIKILVLLVLYGVLAPALGLIIKDHRKLQRAVFFLMCFMTLSGFFYPAEWGLSLAYEEDYRGQTRGFHFFFNVAFAEALIIATFLESPRRFRWLPPGLILYWAYVALSFVSIINAPFPHYTMMALLKFSEVVIIFIATYNFIRTTQDLRFFLTTFSITMLWQLFAVLKHKYVDHMYQIAGTFEHQNALAMYTTLIGLVFLSAAVGPRQPRSKLYLIAFMACAWIVECTLSRGGLVVFLVGTAFVMGFSLVDKITPRRIIVVSVLTAVFVAGALMSLNTIIERFNSPYNADSRKTREMLNLASREMLSDFPLGVGWNNYGVTINPPFRYGAHIDEYFRKYGDATKADTNKGIVESHYWLILAETGYQGFLSYFVLIVFFLWLNLRAALFFRNHFLGAVSLGIAVGCTCNYLQSFLERVLTQQRSLMLWLLLMAVTSRIEAWRRKAKAQELSQPRRMERTQRICG